MVVKGDTLRGALFAYDDESCYRKLAAAVIERAIEDGNRGDYHAVRWMASVGAEWWDLLGMDTRQLDGWLSRCEARFNEDRRKRAASGLDRGPIHARCN